jgi:TetR/AcrR family transcriptional repressor of mexJK operon
VVRTRAAVIAAARELFLEKGYAGTTMEEIAAVAGLAKRTLYNNYADKEALFKEIVSAMHAYAEGFARGLAADFEAAVASGDVATALHDLGGRLALAILRPEVIALRRLLIGEARTFPQLAIDYYDHAPGRVIAALGDGFGMLSRAGLVRVTDARAAGEQFAYLVVGAPLDRALLVGRPPSKRRVLAGARDGVETFLARYGSASRARKRVAKA